MAKIIMGIQLKERMADANRVQELLTKYGCSINTRIGLHGASKDSCSPQGLILLEFMDGAEKEAAELEKELSAYVNVDVRKMEF